MTHGAGLVGLGGRSKASHQARRSKEKQPSAERMDVVWGLGFGFSFPFFLKRSSSFCRRSFPTGGSSLSMARGRRLSGGLGGSVGRGDRTGPSAGPREFFFSSSSSSSSSSSTFRLFRWYTNLLDRHPVRTKMATSGLIAASGDALCQLWFPLPTSSSAVAAGQHGGDDDDDDDDDDNKASSAGVPRHVAQLPLDEGGEAEGMTSSSSSPPPPPARWDWARTGRFGALGTFLVAPTVHVWYNRLHRFTSALLLLSSSGKLLASRVAIDQGLFAPAFTALWLVALRALEGHHQPIDWTALQESVPRIVVANWALWVPAQVVNFAVVPLKFQVLYSNGVALAWNVYLSYTTSSAAAASAAATNSASRRRPPPSSMSSTTQSSEPK
jgi:protein Mpv17